MIKEHKGNWYPSAAQLESPGAIERSMRRVLQEVYAMKRANTVPRPNAKPEEQPSFLSAINGLPVEPFDPNTLADGTKLTWVAAHRRFEFK